MLAISEAVKWLNYAAGGNLPSELDHIRIINRVGHALCRAHPWTWLRNNSTTLSFTADQNWVAVPAGMHRIVGYEASSSFYASLTLTTPQHIAELVSSAVEVANFNYYATLVFSPRTGGGAPYKRLRIYPTPTASTADVFTIFWDSEWTDVTDDDNALHMPDWMEDVYLEMLGLYARGWTREEPSAFAALEGLKSSDAWRQALAYDGTVMPDAGPIRGGAVDSGYSVRDWGSDAEVTKS